MARKRIINILYIVILLLLGQGQTIGLAWENQATSLSQSAFTDRNIMALSAQSAPGFTVYTQDFESETPGSSPSDWLDTAAYNSMTPDDSLFHLFDRDGNLVFGTISSDSNIHSHFTGPGSQSLTAIRYTGRMLITDPRGGIGVTFRSLYPNSDTYYRLRRYNNNAFHINPHGTNVSGDTDTGVVPSANTWYWFLVEVEDTSSQTEIRAKVWAEGSPEPAAWQAQAIDASSKRIPAGTFGLWAYNNGEKYWDDLAVSYLAPPNTVPPTISILGDNPASHEAGTPYADPGATASDDLDGDLSANILVTNSVDPNTLGSYTVSYTVSDSSGNTATAVRTVEVINTSPPTITILGDNPASHEAGTPYNDPGATANDDIDGDLSANILVTNNVDPNTLGSYTVSYAVSDSSGNSATASRTVEVINTSPPTITILGDNPASHALGTPYNDPGATANDDLDGDLSANILVTNSVDPNTLGSYTVSYAVSDSSGTTTTAIRTVEVLETDIGPLNQPPVANNDSAITTAAGAVDINVLQNDSDPDGSLNPASVTIFSQPASGSLSVDPATGWVTYTHDGSTASSDLFSYTVEDNDGAASNPTSVSVTINTPGVLAFPSDDFDRNNLGHPSIWQFVNPLGDGWVSMLGADSGDAHLSLSVPEGVSHDPWSINRSVRVMRSALDIDFEVETKFVSEPASGYQIQGIIIEQDENNWLRYDLYHNGSGLHLFAATTINGNSVSRFNLNVNPGDAHYLRVSRSGDTWTFQYATDGTTWITAGSFSLPISVHAVGPFAANHPVLGYTPAFTAVVDYFFNTAEPIAPEDGGAPADSLPPFIHTIQEIQGPDSVTLLWRTDELALGTIEYGTTTAYGSSLSDGGGTTSHSVNLTGLVAGDTYHYRILSQDSLGQSSASTDFTFQFQERPVIHVWYGNDQAFGQIGQPQSWVNILGNVSSDTSITNLVYSLNNGPAVNLSLGPDGRRLANPGDFNIDLAVSDLLVGNNTVRITATDSLGNPSTETVTVSFHAGNLWPLPYTIDWSTTPSDGDLATPDAAIQTVAQVVDGNWSIDGSVVRTIEPGYDRLIDIGDMAWDDFEATVPLTIHSVLSTDFGVGLLFGWNGHTNNPVFCSQPKCGWIPFGAIGWITQGGVQFYDTGVQKSIPISGSITYWLKMRVETSSNSATYSLKLWQDGSPEPADWDISHTDLTDPVINGSMLLITHMADVSFGTVSVIPLTESPNQPPVANNDSAITTTAGAVDINVLQNDSDPDGSLNPASVTIFSQPASGSLSVDPATGWVTYTHDGSTASSDLFSYTVEDNDGAASNPTSVSVTINTPGVLAFIPDDFNACIINPAWTFNDPLGDSTYELVGTFTDNAQLAITVPSGVEHQVWTTGINAPRVMQAAEDTDLELEVKFNSLLTQQYQEQGLLVEGFNGNFVRSEFFSASGGSIYLYIMIIENFNNLVYSHLVLLPDGLPAYMRLTRVGDSWTQWISYDGVEWITNTSFVNFIHPMTVTQVGVYAGNALGGSSPGHTALVDYFNNNLASLGDEDSARNTLTWTVEGRGTLTVDPISSNYACGTPVTLNAEADPGWVFSGWSGDLSGSTNPETVLMDGPKTITATFVIGN